MITEICRIHLFKTKNSDGPITDDFAFEAPPPENNSKVSDVFNKLYKQN